MEAPAQGDGTSAGAAGVFAELVQTVASARGWSLNLLELLSLETRRAGLTLVWMVAGGLAAAVLMVAAWAGVMAALALWAVSSGYPPIATALMVAGANLLAGLGLMRFCIGLSRDLLFAATRRQLAGTPDAEPSAS